ncbi:uncharacterized protein LOC128208518 [Mya arenaria]|uniref:uncharacterized protein LOC128208518 n=1 Tax=Mya arenaria TaxID=6604 RepID=UPI0022E8C3AD|nr:uncharacterized protein LOC128208518 [Mya arenaria]
MDRGDLRMMSLLLSRVLEDIGVSSYIIFRRRRTWLEIDTHNSMLCTMNGKQITHFTFGSQSEGTTTPGMQSDVDSLRCLNSVHVILDLDEWKQEDYNLLVKTTEQSPPQHCWLQRLRTDLPLPVTHAMLRNDIECEGIVLHSNAVVVNREHLRRFSLSDEIVRHGPSISWTEARDNVLAYKCARLPDECQILFQRPRPGHWPNPDILERARQTGVFLVPQGYTESPSRPSKCRSTALHVTQYDLYYPKSKLEWRLSTSMMERIWVFDFNIIQHKVYVLLKMLRKSFLQPIVGDRFSTFHMKTCMFFTIETYPPDIWREDNLVQCVIYCLTTLKRWLKIKYCPHYTIAGVNLFTGKLFQYEQNIIAKTVTNMLTSNLQCCHFIEMDSLGAKVMALQLGIVISENKSKNIINQTTSITSNLCYEFIGNCQANVLLLMDKTNSWDLQQFEQANLQYITTLLNISDQGTALQQESATFPLACLTSNLASALASRCIYLGQPITQDILNLYRLSFDSDLLSTKLKFASMLYRSGQYEAAENCLSY